MKNFMKDAKLSLSEEQLKQLKHAEDNMYEVLEKALDNAMQIGEIPKGNAKFVAHAFVSLLSIGNFKDENHNPILTNIDELAQEIVSFIERIRSFILNRFPLIKSMFEFFKHALFIY